MLAKRNRGIWVCARNNLDLPMLACPNDLSEPRYASLVFDPFCTVSHSLTVALCATTLMYCSRARFVVPVIRHSYGLITPPTPDCASSAGRQGPRCPLFDVFLLSMAFDTHL